LLDVKLRIELPLVFFRKAPTSEPDPISSQLKKKSGVCGRTTMALSKPIKKIAIVMLFQLGGGQGGIQHFMEHLSGPVASRWKDLGTFSEWPEGSKQTIVDGVLKAANGRSIDELAEMRDELLPESVKLRMQQAETAQAT
jgi:hypothetical protein